MMIEVDLSELTAWQAGIQALSAGEVLQMAQPHFETSIKAINDNAKRNVRSRSGRLVGSGFTSTVVTGNAIVSESDFLARSERGFPYPVAIEFGRRGFGPVQAKALRFEVGGKVVFTQRVGPAPAQHFHTRGLTQATPVIFREMQALETEIARAIEAG